jgi:hypothetical protein
MKTRILSSLVPGVVAGLVLGLVATGASAACLAEYKAKRDDPLELIYDTAQVGGPCTIEAASAELSARLGAQGITLLKVLSVTGQ